MGPYHFARMRALSRVRGIDLTIVEATSTDDHSWTRTEQVDDLRLTTLSSAPKSERVMKETQPAFARILNDSRPDVVVGPGYFERHTLEAMVAYQDSNPKSLALLWSETTALDHPRKQIREAIKTLIVSAFDGALVAGSAHAAYLRLLGMPAADIQIVGNCVDNDFFSGKAEEAWQTAGSQNETLSNYFLFVGRMIPEKNIARLLQAYYQYRMRAGSNPWELVLVGSGPEESSLRKMVIANNIEGVRFAGLLQIDELPQYYARAGCFVLPSTSEPWGLVVNEAMASGIPVLVSNRCGCGPDLVYEGQNGFAFDPLNAEALADLLFRISHGNMPLKKLGLKSKEIVAAYTPTLFAQRADAHISALSQRRANRLCQFSARQTLTRLALRGLGAMTIARERLPVR